MERTTVHISDDTGRIAMLEKRTIGTATNDHNTKACLARFIYSNHLQSASLELDEDAAVISYEEYHPYGTTAYQANNSDINAVAKRYRYTGKERDEESGLYYHGARYYIPWLCRWTACDPMQSEMPNWSSYCYGFCNPITYNDPSGMVPGDGNEPIVVEALGFSTFSSVPTNDHARVYQRPQIDGGFVTDNRGSNINPIVLEDVSISPVESRDGATLYYGENLGNEQQIREEAPRNKEQLAMTKILQSIHLDERLIGEGYNTSRREIARQEYESNEAWGANIRGGFFGAIGSLFGGKTGAAKGAVVDGVVMSFAGVGTPYGKVGPSRPVELPSVPTTEFTITSSGGKASSAQYSQLKQFYAIAETANAVVESLQKTGNLPPEYVTKSQAMTAGWSKGKALNNYVPGGQIGGDIYKNDTRLLPNTTGRQWFEADIGLNNTMGRNKQAGTRLLYSNDGLLYITPNHYETMIFLGRYK